MFKVGACLQGQCFDNVQRSNTMFKGLGVRLRGQCFDNVQRSNTVFKGLSVRLQAPLTWRVPFTPDLSLQKNDETKTSRSCFM